MINNVSIKPHGEAFTIGIPEMEQMTTMGVNEFRAIPDTSKVNEVVAGAEDILEKYKFLGKQAQEKISKDFPSGSGEPKEEYDEDVRKDEVKRVKDNIRDESNIERPFGWNKMKSFSELKSSLLEQFKRVDSILNDVKEHTQKARLNYLKSKISNDLDVIASMENADWKEEKFKSVDDNTRGKETSFFKKDNTGEQINTLNDELKRASIENIKSPILRKKALEELDEVQKKNIEQTITELEKNTEVYQKDIDVLETVVSKMKSAAKDEDETEKEEPKEKETPKEDDKKDDKKEEKKDDKKTDKKIIDKKPGDKKINLKDKMKRLRELRDKKKLMPKPEKKEIGPSMELPPDILKESPKPEKKEMPFKDDLTAIFNSMKNKTASYWEIQDFEKNTILKFTGADAYGKDIFKEFNWFSSKPYGDSILAKIRNEGLKATAELVNGKYNITKHAEMIEDKINKTASIKKEAIAPEEFIRKLTQPGDNKVKEFGNKIIPLFKEQLKQRKAENELLQKKVSELESKLKEKEAEKENLEDEKVRKIKAERALTLSSIMADKGHIKSEDISKVASELTVMDDMSFAMMEDIFNKKVSKIEETNTIKKAFKIKSGLKNVPIMPEDGNIKKTFIQKLSNALIKPKLAKIQEYYSKEK